jgi:hypothetical protein
VISIERDGNGYKVKVSDPGFGRYTLRAGTPQEAAGAVLHYYGADHDEAACASCEQIKREGSVKERKRGARA